MAAGREWALQHDPERRLSFADSRDAADGTQLLLSTGALQYLDYSLPEFLQRLQRPPPHVLVNLTPMHPSRGYFTLQNLGIAIWPYRHGRPRFPHRDGVARLRRGRPLGIVRARIEGAVRAGLHDRPLLRLLSPALSAGGRRSDNFGAQPAEAAYPHGFIDCQRQASRHIASTSCVARHPSSCCASVGSA